MNRIYPLLAAALLAACATEPRPPDAYDDFVATSELETVDKIKTADHDSWYALTDRFIVYNSRGQDYLFSFRGRCGALIDRRLMGADARWESFIRPRVDTIRGCLIGEIYEVTPDQVEELRNIGTPPGTT